MSRLSLIFVAVILFSLSAKSTNRNTEKPNVLFIAIDDLRPEIDGRDISKLLLSNEMPEKKPFVYYTRRGKLAGVRDGAYKLISDGEKFHLYNIEEDISEEYDLKEKQAERFEEMQKLMHAMDTKITNGSREVGAKN